MSNQHYCSLTPSEIDKAFKKEPILCKLTDFGESRAREVQTATVKSTCATNNVGHGTPSYMAPEILTDARLTEATSVDLKCIDIWALGRVIFSVLNPDISFPYKRDLEQARAVTRRNFKALDHIKELQEQHIKPSMSSKYQHIQTTKWSHLLKAYDECTSFTPTQRSTLDRILQLVNNKEAKHHDVIPLALLQGSAIEDIDKRIAGGHEAIVEDSLQNDGTNSCAFLCAIIGEGISDLSIAPSWQDVVTLTEDVIRNAPSSFDFLRDKGFLYDSQEAASILWK